jgi:hypothetical protein
VIDLAATVAELQRLDAPDEALGTLRLGRGIGSLRTAPMLIPAGRAWRLGVLLLDVTGGLYATGEVTRAIEPLIAVTNRSAEAERKRELRRMAARGPFAPGETVNVDYLPLSLENPEEPLSRAGDELLVRLPSGSRVPLERYLDDRVAIVAEGLA